MDNQTKRSILQMCRGGIMERADLEITRLIENILDPNTKATEKRRLTLTLELKPDDTRQNIAVSCTAKSALAATTPITTALYVADADNVVEMVPQIPGQMAMDTAEQETPAVLKLIKFA